MPWEIYWIIDATTKGTPERRKHEEYEHSLELLKAAREREGT